MDADIDRNWSAIIVVAAVLGAAVVILFGWIITLTYKLTTLKQEMKFALRQDPLGARGFVNQGPPLPRATSPAFGQQPQRNGYY